MKTNLLLVSLFDKGTKEIASKLAKEYDLYYADVNDLLEYNLYNAKEIEKNCGLEYLNKLKRNALKEIGTYENTLISVPYGIFASENNSKYFDKYATIVFLDFKKSAIEKYIEKATLTQKNLNELKVMLIAFDEMQKLCCELSHIQIDLANVNFESNYKKIKKHLDKYYL